MPFVASTRLTDGLRLSRRERADKLTFANLNQVLSECAHSLARLNSSIEDE
jgi:hypothetical protein